MGQDVGYPEVGQPEAEHLEDDIHHYDDVSEVPRETLRCFAIARRSLELKLRLADTGTSATTYSQNTTTVSG